MEKDKNKALQNNNRSIVAHHDNGGGGQEDFIRADLHIHTHFSDGEDSPERVIQLAHDAGVRLVSVTDHDTADALPRAKEAATALGLDFLSGIELSCQGVGEVHILGYGIDSENAQFKLELKRLKDMRISRIMHTLDKLKSLGIALSYEEIECGEYGTCGRVHIARVLVKKGICRNVGDAFSRYLGYGKPAYVHSQRLTVGEGIEIIRLAGGKSVLAHPLQVDCPRQHLEALVKSYRDMGLGGIETDYYAHTITETLWLRGMAQNLGMFCTCGSDYHGKIRNSPIKVFALNSGDYAALIK